MKIVDVAHLSFEYGNRRVLHNLNFSIRQGGLCSADRGKEAVKSTLMKDIVGRVGVGQRKGCDMQEVIL